MISNSNINITKKPPEATLSPNPKHKVSKKSISFPQIIQIYSMPVYRRHFCSTHLVSEELFREIWYTGDDVFKFIQAVTAVCKWKNWVVSTRSELLQGRRACCKGKWLPPSQKQCRCWCLSKIKTHSVSLKCRRRSCVMTRKEIKWKILKKCLFITECIKDNRNLMNVSSKVESSFFKFTGEQSQFISHLIIFCRECQHKMRCTNYLGSCTTEHLI